MIRIKLILTARPATLPISPYVGGILDEHLSLEVVSQRNGRTFLKLDSTSLRRMGLIENQGPTLTIVGMPRSRDTYVEPVFIKLVPTQFDITKLRLLSQTAIDAGDYHEVITGFDYVSRMAVPEQASLPGLA